MADDALNKRFDLIKKKLTGEVQASQQQGNEAMQRKLAQTGALNTGAALKLQAQQDQQNQKQIADVGSQVEAERAGAQYQQEEAQKNRQFAREERIGAQTFQGQEAEKQRGFSNELFKKEMAFKKDAQRIQQSQFGEQMKMAMEQFKLDTRVSEFNMEMARAQFNKPTMLDNFFRSHGLNPDPGHSPLAGGNPFSK